MYCFGSNTHMHVIPLATFYSAKLYNMTFDLHFHANMYDEFLLLSNHIYDIVELVCLKI